jgi:tetratricopeptide (TPR) repeat protein
MDYWPLKRLNIKAFLEKLPLFLIGVLSALITYISQSRTAATVLSTKYGPLRIPFVLCHNIIFYLYKLLWPANLSSHYPFPKPLDLSNQMVFAGLIGTTILIVLLLLSLRRTPAFLTSWLLFFIAILPTMQIIGFSNVIASDKFAYLPSVGLLILLTWLLHRFCSPAKDHLRRTVAVIVVLILATAETTATRRYLAHWQTSVSLCSHMLRLTPDAPHLHTLLGTAFHAEGELDRALECYQRTLQLKPDYAYAHNNLGTVLESRGELDRAVEHYNKAIKFFPRYTDAYYNLGRTFNLKGQPDKAADYYRRALDIYPDHILSLNNLGNVLRSQNKFDEASDSYRKAVLLSPSDPAAYYNLGYLFDLTAQPDHAADYYRRTLRLAPDHLRALNNLGTVLHSQNKFDAAVTCYRKAIRLSPNAPVAYFNLANTLAAQGKYAQAEENYRRVLEINPHLPDARDRLQKVLKLQQKTD